MKILDKLDLCRYWKNSEIFQYVYEKISRNWIRNYWRVQRENKVQVFYSCVELSNIFLSSFDSSNGFSFFNFNSTFSEINHHNPALYLVGWQKWTLKKFVLQNDYESFFFFLEKFQLIKVMTRNSDTKWIHLQKRKNEMTRKK